MKKNPKFLEFMARLDESELARFEKYLRLEYPKEGNAMSVFRYYKRFFPGKEHSDRMALPYAFRKIYGVEMGPRMSDPKKLWNAFSRLYGWLKDFLILEKLKADRFTADVFWMDILLEKGLNSEHSKQAIAAYHTNYSQFYDLKACLQQIELGRHYRQQLVQGRPIPDYKAIEPCILKIHENADLISLKMKCELLTIKGVRPSKPPVHTADEAIPPLQLIYHHIHLMLTKGATEHYEEIEKLLQAHSIQISRASSNDILRYLHYHAARMFREADEKVWSHKLHRLNKVLLEKEVYSPQKEMPSSHFQNIVSVACVANDLDWVNIFIEEYSRFLPVKTREENKVVAQTALAFARKDFHKVLELSGKPLFKDEIQIFRIRIFQLRAMYELGLDLSDALNAYNTHLLRRRNPVTAYKESAIAFMSVLNMLIEKKVTKKTLIKSLEAYPQIFVRTWLREKIDAYKSTVYRGGG
ncbi:MAG: hypothetical protein Q7T20_00340 [Saprospiraceae bacterium]|nr:hypothetical protein [Saprospiraceae bacterium]